MANPLPPPPIKSPDGSYAWLDWYNKLQRYVSEGGNIPWSVIDFTGSDIVDIQTRNHNVLQNIQGGTTGEFYHLTASEYADLGNSVPNTRTLTAGAGLTGGGNLTADRTFDVGANADGSIVVNANDVQVGVLATDAQHGNRGGGSLHANATTATAGFMSAADKTTFDGMGTYLSASTTGTALTSGVVFNATSVSLTAGDWDVSGVIGFTGAGGATLTNMQVGITTTSATIPTAIGTRSIIATIGAADAANIQVSPVVRISLGSTTTVYIVGHVSFSSGTATGDWFIRARRARV